MLKALIKKQFASMWFGITNRSKGNTKKTAMLFGFLFVYVFGYFGVMNYNLFKPLCLPFAQAGIGWLYFALAAIFAIVFSIIGGVFTVQSQVYEARDNDALLSMPIPPIKILISRLLPIYAQVFLFSSAFLIPVCIPYAMSVEISFGLVLSWALLIFAVPCVGLVLCCLLGWFTAWVSSRMTSKNLFTIVLSLLFIAIYFSVALKMQDYMTSLITSGEAFGNTVKTYLWVFYQFGKAATGDYLSLVLLLVAIAAVVALAFMLLARGYLSIITRKKAKKKAVYRSERLKSSSASMALFRKEAKLFFGNAIYLLNCGLGTLFIIAATVYLIFAGKPLAEVLITLYPGGYTVNFMAIIAISAIASMNIVSAPSISLEGSSLWLLQSLPITPWQVLKTKLYLHLAVTAPFAGICGGVVAYILEADLLTGAVMVVTPMLFVLFVGCLGLIFNLKKPNFNWETITVAVKQSASALLTMLVGWACLSVFIILFVVGVFERIPNILCCYLPLCVFVLADLFMLMWLKDKGAKILATL